MSFSNNQNDEYKLWQYDIQIFHQIVYVEYSLKKLLYANKNNNFEAIFFHIQVILTSLANISKILKNNGNEVAKNRCITLEKRYNLNIKKIPILLKRDLRNTCEHIDERIDKFIPLFFKNDMSTGSFNRECNGLRFFDKNKQEICFINENGKIKKISIMEIKKELKYLKSLKNLNYVFDRYPDVYIE